MMSLGIFARTSVLGTILGTILGTVLGTAHAAAATAPHAAHKPTVDELFETWERIQEPTQGRSESIGAFSAGCLAGGVRIENAGKGFVTMRPSRKRYYGHPELTEYLRGLALRLQREKLPRMLIGDLCHPRGGPSRSGHVSHQSGLDVDIWFMMSKRLPTHKERETWGAPSYVIGRKKLRSNWSQEQVKLIANAADFEQVNRIFVSPAVKKYFCQHFPNAPWLYKLRAWWSHHDHLHVRLNCPKDSPMCEPQPPLNPGVAQCAEDLDWWFSKEADDQWADMIKNPAPREFPALPAACEEMVKDPDPARSV